VPSTIGDDRSRVDAWSTRSLFVQTVSFRDELIGSGTAFVVMHDAKPFLVTAEHVLSGVNPETGARLGKEPERLRVFHHSTMMLHGVGGWHMTNEPLRDEHGEPRWTTHPRKRIKDMDDPFVLDIDVAVLPLSDLHERVLLYPIDLGEPPQVAPGFPISVVGFPFGRGSDGFFPIWKTGHVASDVYWNDERREFLIDITTREGMSGAPVYARQWAPRGNEWDVRTSFLGVYSGRTRVDSEIGIVWRADLLRDILQKVGSVSDGEAPEPGSD
jgi:hypothetical protein